MKDLIYRRAAIDTLDGEIKLKDSDDVDNVARYIQQVARKINELPSVERKKGRWIEHEVKRFDGCHTGRFFEECSECGKLTPEYRKITEYHRWYFCPNCGVEMQTGEEKEINDAIH